MGVQQLLLIVLTVIIIGIAIASGIAMFNQSIIRSNRHAVINDLGVYASVANSYYKTPTDMGGGARTWDVDALGMWLGTEYNAGDNSISNDNGTFVLSSNGDELTIIGYGKETGTNGSTNVQATLTLIGVTSESVTTIEN